MRRFRIRWTGEIKGETYIDAKDEDAAIQEFEEGEPDIDDIDWREAKYEIFDIEESS
jgi:hypothetical protein